ncbi:MAG: sodium:proton antiporter, partial [Gammaproteobacteria bacterium]|nr:sodium:proton antiporter [Gammaproteobacteria bacterium]
MTVFALIALLAALGTGSMRLFQQSLGYWIGWAGVITAFAATLAAVYQEDIKYLLAYSSIGQLGYIVLAAGIADHAGWTAVMYLTVNH